MSSRHIPGHVLREAVVFDDLRLLYVPVPKAASTTILWALAKAAGLRSGDFLRSRKLEVTRALAIHDTSLWGREHRLAGRGSKELERILWSDEWFRVSIVRDPARRLWSAWVSKVLARDPRFVARFGSEDWFPRPPGAAEDVVHSFRRFVRILPTRAADWHDPHWSPQVDLLGLESIEYGHVGRLERLDDTVSQLEDYVVTRGHTLQLPAPESPSLIPFDLGVLDGPALEACNNWTAKDREAFAYEALVDAPRACDPAWVAAVEGALPAIRAVIARNERITDLRRMLVEAA
jgi:Sulfotransferase family